MASYDQSSTLRSLIGAMSRDTVTNAQLGIVAETISRLTVISSTALVGGTVYYMGVPLLAGDVITSASVSVQSAGVGMSLSKLGLYAADGTLLASTADQTTSWETTGKKTVAFSAAYSVPSSGWYYAAVVANAATTVASLSTGSGTSITTTVIGSGKLPFGSLVGQSDLPSSGAIANGTTPRVFWIALS